MDVQKPGKELGNQTQWIDWCEPHNSPNSGTEHSNRTSRTKILKTMMNYSCLKCQTAQRTQQGPIEGSSSTVLLRCMITIMKFILSIFLGLESVAKRISGSTIKHSMTIYDLYSRNYYSISFVDCLLAGTCKKYTRHERSCACNMSEGITQGRTLLKGSKRYESPG